MQHRSRLIFWLLLAATISADILAFKTVADRKYSDQGYLGVAFHSLILGQLSVVCIWSALLLRPTIWTRLAPVFAAAISAMLVSVFTRFSMPYQFWIIFTTYFGYFGFHALALISVLWGLRRTDFWRRRTGTDCTWQFSMLHVLAVMTLIAVLAALLRNNQFLGNGAGINIVVAASCVALAVANVILWSMPWFWFLRLAGVIGVAVLLGVGASMMLFTQTTFVGMNVVNVFHAAYLIQALVLSLWLGIGPTLPPIFSEVVGSEHDEARDST